MKAKYLEKQRAAQHSVKADGAIALSNGSALPNFAQYDRVVSPIRPAANANR